MKVPLKLSRRKEILLDFLLVFIYTAMLIRPYFKARYTDKWASIESTFIADARFLSEHWPHPQWQPLWYAGTRFDYIYPPALRYGTAVISKLTGFWPVKAYHFYVAFFYALGIAGVYLLMRVGSKSRPFAYLGAVATSLMSPIFLFLPRFREDAWMLEPQRLGVLVKYGEGPHMSALALIPIALAFAWLALEKRRPWAVALAALFSAGVAANNFYGAAALAVFYPILVWSLWITRQEKRIVVPAIAIPILAYGLTAFWLVPSYFKVTAENLKYVSEHGTTWSIWVAVVVAVAFAVSTDKFARAKPERAWAVFVDRLRRLFLAQRVGRYLLQLPHFRRTRPPLARARHDLHHGGRPRPAMAVGPPRHRPPRRRAGRCDRGLLDHHGLYPPRLAHVSAHARLPESRRVPRHRLALEEHARCARLPLRVRALLVRRLARPGAARRRLRPGPSQR